MSHGSDGGLSSEQQWMLDYWNAARGDRQTPLLADLDPLRFKPGVLPHLIVADYLNDVGLVRYRLVGEEMVSRWGSNFRGKRSDEMFSGDYRVFLERCFALSRSERCPIYSESIFRWNDGGWIKTTRLLLPFSEGRNGVPVRAVVVQVFLPHDGDTDVTPEIRLIWADARSSENVVVIPGVERWTANGSEPG